MRPYESLTEAERNRLQYLHKEQGSLYHLIMLMDIVIIGGVFWFLFDPELHLWILAVVLATWLSKYYADYHWKRINKEWRAIVGDEDG